MPVISDPLGGSRSAALLSLLVLAVLCASCVWPLHAQANPNSKPAPAQKSSAPGGRIHGFAKQGTIPLSGVDVIIVGIESGKKFGTLTDGSGSYSVTLPEDGLYSIRAVFRAVTSSPQQIHIGAGR